MVGTPDAPTSRGPPSPDLEYMRSGVGAMRCSECIRVTRNGSMRPRNPAPDFHGGHLREHATTEVIWVVHIERMLFLN